MYFVGQTHIKNQLKYLLPYVYDGQNLSFLLFGPSGCGKTTLALKMGYYLTNDFQYTLPIKGNLSLDLRKRVIIVDEIHTLEKFEPLYPLIDKREHVFIFCTTESASLPEPFVNRNISFYFSSYTDKEIVEILNNMHKHDYKFLIKIAELSNYNPRVAKSIYKRMLIFEKWKGKIKNQKEFDFFVETLGYSDEGLTIEEARYINVLRKLKSASLSTLVRLTKLPEKYIKEEVEPVLLDKGLIQISTRGRKLNG